MQRVVYFFRVIIITIVFIVIIWCALTIELTLLWSSVSGVYGIASVGQLIPFIIGLVGLVRTVHLIIIDQAINVSLIHLYGLSVTLSDFA